MSPQSAWGAAPHLYLVPDAAAQAGAQPSADAARTSMPARHVERQMPLDADGGALVDGKLAVGWDATLVGASGPATAQAVWSPAPQAATTGGLGADGRQAGSTATVGTPSAEPGQPLGAHAGRGTASGTQAWHAPAPRPAPRPAGWRRATGAWHPSDPVGQRKFAHIGDVALECGEVLADVVVAFETWGELNAAGDNAILVLHALTGDSHVAGQAGPGHPTPGWWEGLIGPGAPLDTDKYCVVAPNVLGGCQGTTGPASLAPDGAPWGSRFPYVTIRDQVAAELLLADQLGVARWALVVGGSMGGMRALEWAASAPSLVERVAIIASSAASSADQIAWAHAQLSAIRGDHNYLGGDYYLSGAGPTAGLAVARQIAHTTYRAASELNSRFGREVQTGERVLGGGGRFQVQSYLDYHGDKLAGRFDAGSYVALTESIISHDVGRGRGGVAAALARVSARALVVAVDSDRLYPPEECADLAAQLPRLERLFMVHSERGHDGFLADCEQFFPALRELLAR